jgi:hypothetical protein
MNYVIGELCITLVSDFDLEPYWLITTVLYKMSQMNFVM